MTLPPAMQIGALSVFALGACAARGASVDRSRLLEQVRNTPLIITKVAQGDAQAPDRVEVFCQVSSRCAPFKICTGMHESAEDCSATQQPPAPGARVIIELDAAIGDEGWVWLSDVADKEQWNTRVGLFNCAPREGRARADCALAAFGACTSLLGFGASTGACPE